MSFAEELRCSRKRFLPTTIFKYVSYFCIVISCVSLVAIVGYVLVKGVGHINISFLIGEYDGYNFSIAGPLVTTFKLILVSLLIATPIGIGCAIYLVEYTKKGNKLVKVIRLATETLAGVPSIIFGLFGYLVFVIGLKMGEGIWAGSITLSLMILPTIVTTVEESIKAVPDTFREGSFGLGAGKLRTVFKIVLPSSISGILSSIILSIGRIVSESACVLFTAGSMFNMPKTFGASGATLAVAMYLKASEGFFEEAYAIGVVLIVLVVSLNLLSTFIAKKFERKSR